MNKKYFAFFIICLFFVAIITSACMDEGTANPFKSANVGDYVTMGDYPQTKNGDIQPIEWLVLAKEEDRMLLISRYGLDTMRFDSRSGDWSVSEIHKWANNYFYRESFSEQEKKIIKYVNGDKVFLLSKKEAEKYFANDDARCCEATEYAIKKSAIVSNGSMGGRTGYTWWWLRTTSPDYSNNVYLVKSAGDIDYFCCHNHDIVVRPALWIKL